MKLYIAAAFALPLLYCPPVKAQYVCCPDPYSPAGQMFQDLGMMPRQPWPPNSAAHYPYVGAPTAPTPTLPTPTWMPPDRQQDYPWVPR